MRKEHIRSYRVIENGDLEVVDETRGHIDLSSHYAEIARERGKLQVEACLDVFRFDNGQLAWMASPNGHGTEAAASLLLLLSLYLADLGEAAGSQRGL